MVSDFGLARRVDGVEYDLLAGTPAFMAPEQASTCWGPVGRATDVYGLGALLYALLSGRPPFRGNVADIVSRVVSASPPTPLVEQVPGISTEINELCMACLRKDPRSRPADAGMVAARLWRCLLQDEGRGNLT